MSISSDYTVQQSQNTEQLTEHFSRMDSSIAEERDPQDRTNKIPTANTPSIVKYHTLKPKDTEYYALHMNDESGCIVIPGELEEYVVQDGKNPYIKLKPLYGRRLSKSFEFLSDNKRFTPMFGQNVVIPEEEEDDEFKLSPSVLKRSASSRAPESINMKVIMQNPTFNKFAHSINENLDNISLPQIPQDVTDI